jgi:hypothetical protein
MLTGAVIVRLMNANYVNFSSARRLSGIFDANFNEVRRLL